MPFEKPLVARIDRCFEGTLRLASPEAQALLRCRIGLRRPLLRLAGAAQIDDIAAHGFFRKASIDTTLGSLAG